MQTIFSQGAGGATVRVAAAFPIQSCRVDNFSNQWYTLGEAPFAFIPPYTAGVIIALRGAGNIDLLPGVPPTGFTEPAPNVGETVVLTAYSDPLPPNPGYSVDSATFPVIGNQALLINVINQKFFFPPPGPPLIVFRAFIIRALKENTDTVWLGLGTLSAAAVIANGFPLYAGDAITIPMVNPDPTGSAGAQNLPQNIAFVSATQPQSLRLLGLV